MTDRDDKCKWLFELFICFWELTNKYNKNQYALKKYKKNKVFLIDLFNKTADGLQSKFK